MREIVRVIRDFIKADFNIYIYAYTILFLTASIILNYTYSLNKIFIDRHFGTYLGMLVYFGVYFFAYMAVIVPSLIIKKQTFKFRQTEFWVKIILFFGVFAVMTGYWQYRGFARDLKETYSEFNYLVKIFSNLKRFVPFFIVFLMLKLIYDKKDDHIFGLRYKGMNYKPFFLLLLLTIPLVTFASFQGDFQSMYPRFKFWNFPEVFDLTVFQKVVFFETAYALDFVSIEFLFRGALVVGLIKVLGKEAVLPMVAVYVFIHFGKPAGETVSSFFGGFILGIHAYYKKNIFGGIIIHVGIAFFMEAAAILQHYYG